MKFRITTSWEYEVDPADFPEVYGTTDPKEALAIDVANVQADPAAAFWDEEDDGNRINVTGEVIE